MLDERTIRQWFDVFKFPNQLTEVRILGKGKAVYSGYFTDCETMIEEMEKCDGLGGMYATINQIKDACAGREQADKIIKSPKATTNDKEIECRRILLIDFDPERPADTNATDGEVALADACMRKVYRYLRDQGFSAPVVANSGNGFHLYYKINIPNTEENTKIIETFLKALDMMFGDEKTVKVDTSVFNASRIAKIIGTPSNKGSNTKARPQRMSKFIHIPDVFKETSIDYIIKVANEYPQAEAPSRENNYSTERFDIEGFIKEHDIKVAKRVKFSGGEKLILEECPFDSNHKAPDSAIFVMDSGAIAFKCFHASCSNMGWRDVRLHFDPTAYNRKEQEEYHRRRYYYGQRQQKPVQVIKEDGRGKKWLSMTDIKWIDPSSYVSIPSGVTILDQKIMGFTLGDVTILSGLSGAGKTTLLDHFVLNAVQRGYKVAAWSGELQDFRFQSWIDQMAAGKANVLQKYGYSNVYYVPRHIAEVINKWLDGKFWLYNNDYGAGFDQLFSDIKECVEQNGVQMILLDNLMAIDTDDIDGSENERQTKLIKEIKSFAKKQNVHVILVCHPRKEQSFQLLRKESIAGTANLTNLCDNLLISHRVGNDFERRAKDFFGEEQTQMLMQYDLVLEIAKNRSLGVVDQIIGLYYENETRRIKNEVAENIVYGWKEQPVQSNIEFDDDMPDFDSEPYYNKF